MNQKKCLSTTLAFTLLASGCGQNSTSEVDAKLDEATTQIQELQGKVQKLETEVEILEFFRVADTFAFLKPGDEGYSVVKSDIGYLTVKLEDIRPYANGSRVTLQIGNATSATIGGLNAKLDWGSVNGDGTPVNEKAKTRQVKFNDTLRAGAWSHTNVVLEGVPPSELGFVRVSQVGHTNIKLSK